MALTREILVSLLKTEDFKSVHTLKLDGMEISSCFKLLLQEFGVSLFLLTLKNNTLSNGWKPKETEILKAAIMHYGVGNWK